MTALTAAIADAPQIPVPTPINARVSGPTFSARPKTQAPPSAVAKVPSITTSEERPACTTWVSDSPVPSTTMLACSTRLLANATPGARRVLAGTTVARAPPRMMPNTGPPTIGTNRPSALATTATATATPSPQPVLAQPLRSTRQREAGGTPAPEAGGVDSRTGSVAAWPSGGGVGKELMLKLRRDPSSALD